MHIILRIYFILYLGTSRSAYILYIHIYICVYIYIYMCIYILYMRIPIMCFIYYSKHAGIMWESIAPIKNFFLGGGFFLAGYTATQKPLVCFTCGGVGTFP